MMRIFSPISWQQCFLAPASLDGLPPVGVGDNILIAFEIGLTQIQTLSACKRHDHKGMHNFARVRTLKGRVQDLPATMLERKFEAPFVECTFLYLKTPLRVAISVRYFTAAAHEIREVAWRCGAINGKRQGDFVVLASGSIKTCI